MTDREPLLINADATRFLQSIQRVEKTLDRAKERETWLSTIRANPSDWQAMLVFADWLELEEGDLLAAEQWRWIAVVSGSLAKMHKQVPLITRRWPNYNTKVPNMFSQEKTFAAENNIRCMPTYPLTIEDVQAYLKASG